MRKVLKDKKIIPPTRLNSDSGDERLEIGTCSIDSINRSPKNDMRL